MGTIKGTTKGNLFNFEPNDPRLVLITDPNHPRYDRRVELPLVEDFIQDIIKKGVHTAILVFKIEGIYEVFEGRQRVKAAREILRRDPSSKIRIPFVLKTLKPAQSIEMAISANNQRIAETQSVKGEKANQLAEYGHTLEGIAAQYPGSTVAMVKDWMSFADGASEGVKKALDASLVTYTQARKISKMEHCKQQAALELAMEKPKPRRGPQKGPRRRKIKIVATEREEGGFDVDVESKCRLDELDVIIDALGDELEEWKETAKIDGFNGE